MIEVLKQALEALEQLTWAVSHPDNVKIGKDGQASLRQAIAKLKSQEPVPTIEDLEQEIYQNTRNFVSLDVMEWMLKRYYTHPPQRTEQEPVAINWGAVHEKLNLVWYRELSADEGLEEIQDLIDTHPPQRKKEKST